MTPEGKVKRAVRKALARYDNIYTYWPVPAGYGPSSLDVIVCANERFLAIETKAPGKKPTPRQEQTIQRIADAGGETLVVDSTNCEEDIDAMMKELGCYPSR
jgi:hypothetical protein